MNTTILLASSDAAVPVPPAVTVPAGWSSTTFEVTGLAPASAVTLTATLGAATRTATLAVR